jgi:hypothetical protein
MIYNINMNYRLKQRKPLTLEEQESLIKDYDSRIPLKDIESKYQVTRSTIYNTLHRRDNA